MPYEPSRRVKGGMDEGELSLNLNPMMDMFAVLIPALLMMSAVVEITTLDVTTPGDGPRPPESVPLDLQVAIHQRGYTVTTRGAPYDIPLVERTVSCARFRDTRPPPRAQNRERAPCEQAAQSYLVYDTTALSQYVLRQKELRGDERSITLRPAADVEYEALVDVMDATREVRDAAGRTLELFPEVVIGVQ